jgi:nucleotidyltransferase/DNA polymerase involved in DNA repair
MGRLIEDDRLLWAFAVDATRPVRTSYRSKRQPSEPKRNLHRYLITACSPRLKARGVKQGMAVKDAKALAPDMRIIVTNR